MKKTSKVLTNESIATTEKVLISPTEAAAILGVSAVTIRAMIKSGRWNIPHLYAGSRLRIFAAPLREICAHGTYRGDDVAAGGAE